MGIFSKKKGAVMFTDELSTSNKNRAQRRKDVKWERGQAVRDADTKARRIAKETSEAIAARVKRKADAAHERAVQRRLIAGKPVTFSRRRRNYQ